MGWVPGVAGVDPAGVVAVFAPVLMVVVCCRFLDWELWDESGLARIFFSSGSGLKTLKRRLDSL